VLYRLSYALRKTFAQVGFIIHDNRVFQPCTPIGQSSLFFKLPNHNVLPETVASIVIVVPEQQLGFLMAEHARKSRCEYSDQHYESGRVGRLATFASAAVSIQRRSDEGFWFFGCLGNVFGAFP